MLREDIAKLDRLDAETRFLGKQHMMPSHKTTSFRAALIRLDRALIFCFTSPTATGSPCRLHRRSSLRSSCRWAVTGLRALYFRYCYELHIIVKRPASVKRVSFLLREDIAKLDRRRSRFSLTCPERWAMPSHKTTSFRAALIRLDRTLILPFTSSTAMRLPSLPSSCTPSCGSRRKPRARPG